jgi:hypothetical protein
MAGRPTDYNEEIIPKTKEYLALCEDKEVNQGSEESPRYKLKVKIPTIEGLAVHLEINKDTIYEWCEVHPEFSDVIDTLRAKQADRLLNNGLSGDYNPTIAKVLLTKHGYREGIDTDHTTKGEKIEDTEKLKDLETKFNAFIKGNS